MAKLVFQGLPAGVSAVAADFAPGASAVPVVFEAAADADLAGSLVTPGVLLPGRNDVQSAGYRDLIRLVRVRNDQLYLGRNMYALPIACDT